MADQAVLSLEPFECHLENESGGHDSIELTATCRPITHAVAPGSPAWVQEISTRGLS